MLTTMGYTAVSIPVRNQVNSSKQNANADASSQLPSEIKSKSQDFEQEAKEINKLQLAPVPTDAKLLNEETAWDTVPSRVVLYSAWVA